MNISKIISLIEKSISSVGVLIVAGFQLFAIGFIDQQDPEQKKQLILVILLGFFSIFIASTSLPWMERKIFRGSIIIPVTLRWAYLIFWIAGFNL